jgi:hypothetical protein
MVSDQITWYTNVGTAGMDYAHDIVATDDGGFVIAGHTDNNPAIVRDAILAKVDGSGNVVWQDLYGGYSFAWANAITATNDGGFVVAGQIAALEDPPGDAHVFKVADDGAVLWQKRVGGDGWDYAADIVTTSDDGYIVAGNTEPLDVTTDRNILLFKVDDDGNLIWQKTYGNNHYAWANALTPTSDGDLIVVGHIAEVWDWEHQFYILRINADGNLIYEKMVYTEIGESCQDIVPTNDNGFVILGRASHFDETLWGDQFDPDIWADQFDIYLMKIDASANIVWEKTIDVGDEDIPYCIATMPDGGFAISGRTYDYDDGLPWYTHVVRTTDNGTVLWKKSFVFEDQIYGDAVTACSDGGIAVAGRVYLPESGYDAFVMKVDANGVLDSE